MDRSWDDTLPLKVWFEPGFTTKEAKARVYNSEIEAKARVVMEVMCIPHTDFKVSKKCSKYFMRLNGWSLRRHKTVCQKLPEA